MAAPIDEPEIVELRSFYEHPEYRPIIGLVLATHRVSSVDALFLRNPEIAFELHDQICELRRDTAEVGEFEHDLEREIW